MVNVKLSNENEKDEYSYPSITLQAFVNQPHVSGLLSQSLWFNLFHPRGNDEFLFGGRGGSRIFLRRGAPLKTYHFNYYFYGV